MMFWGTDVFTIQFTCNCKRKPSTLIQAKKSELNIEACNVNMVYRSVRKTGIFVF